MIVLWSILAILLVIGVLLLIPVELWVRYRSDQAEPLDIGLRYLFYKRSLYPTAEKGKKSKQATPTAKKEGAKAKRPGTAADRFFDLATLAVDLFEPLLRTVGYLLRRVRVRDMALYMVICREDASATAIGYGRAGGYICSLLAFFRNLFRVDDPKEIVLLADYTGKQYTDHETRFSCRLTFRPWVAVAAAGKLFFGLLRGGLMGPLVQAAKPKRHKQKQATDIENREVQQV